MAVYLPENDRRGLRGGSDSWDDGLAGQILLQDYFGSFNPSVELDVPADTSSSADTTPTFEFVGRDPDNHRLTYQLQVSTSAGFGTTVLDKNSATQAGFIQSAPDLHDNFADGVTGRGLYTLEYGGTAVESGGVLTITPTNNTAGVGAEYGVNEFIDFTGRYVSAKISQIANGTVNTAIVVYRGNSDNVLMYTEDGILYAAYIINSSQTNLSSVTYNATTMAYWRIREFNGTTYWEYSQNETTWTVLHSATNPFSLKAVKPSVQVYEWEAVNPAGSAIYDDFKIGSLGTFTSGAEASYTVDNVDALAIGTYYWRVRAKAPDGTNTYGEWSTIRSFTVSGTTTETISHTTDAYKRLQASPTVSLNTPADTSSTSDNTPALTFIGTDPDNDDVRYNVQVDTVNTFNSQSPGAPTVSAATTTTFATSVTTMAVNMPSVASGNLLIAAVAVRNAGTWTPPSGWTLLNEQAGGGSVGETAVWYRIADGSEGSTVTWTAGTATTAAWHVRKVTNWHGSTAPEYTSTNGDTASVNPPSITPSWGGADTAFIVIGGSSADAMTFSGAPSSYSDLTSTTASSGGGASNIGSATRTASSSTEDPSTFTTSTNRWWSAFTVAVRPASAGGGPIISAVSGTDPGFSGSPDNTDPFTSAQLVTYTVQSALATTTYYWRVRAIDPAGTNTYGSWSSTRSFTVTGSTFTRTHTTDSLKRIRVAPTHTTNSLKRKITLASHSTDSNKKKPTVTSHTTDALKRTASTLSHTTSSVKRRVETASHTTNSLKRSQVSTTHTTDALKKTRVTTSHTTNSLKRASPVSTHTTNSLLRKQSTLSYTTDANKRRAYTLSHTTSSNRKAPTQVSHTVDALKRTRSTVSHTTSSNKKLTTQVTHTTNTLLRKTYTASHTTSSVLRKTNTVTHTTDASIRGLSELLHTTDARTRTSVSSQHTTDVLLRERVSLSHNTDSYIRKTNTITHSTDSLKRKSASSSHTTSSNKKKQNNTLSHTTEALKRQSVSVSHTTDSNKKKPAVATHTTNGLLRKPNTLIHTTNALLRKSNSVEHTTGSNLKKRVETSHTTDASLLRIFVLSHTTSSNKRRASVVQHTTNALLRKASPISHYTNTLLRSVTEVYQTTDSLLRISSNITHSTDSNKRVVSSVSHSTSTVVASSFAKEHRTDAFLYNVYGKKKLIVDGQWVSGTVLVLRNSEWRVSDVLYFDGSDWYLSNQ